MDAKKVLKVLGALAALAATVTAVASLDFGTHPGATGGVNPLGALALAAASLALLKASEA
jgi:hypothetical protein